MKAFIFDPLWDELITDELKNKLKNSGGGVDLVVTKKIAPLKQCKELFEGNDDRVLCINPDYINWSLPSEDYQNIPNLKAIILASTGFDYVDQKAANDKAIPICNIVYFNSESVAEWAVMTMLNLARQIPRLVKDDFPLDYDKDYMKYRGTEIKGKTAGVIGLGHIGKAIADRCLGLGMDVIYWSKSPKETDFKYQELSELFKSADVIFPAVAKNPETVELISDELIKSMKPSALFIDIAHGFKKELLIEQVEHGKLAGYGFEAEPSSFGNYKGNIWAAPAYAWATDKSMQNCMTKWVDNILNAAQGKFPTRVN